jgi:hypothetical protein
LPYQLVEYLVILVVVDVGFTLDRYVFNVTPAASISAELPGVVNA